jgi:hypothetical protein
VLHELHANSRAQQGNGTSARASQLQTAPAGPMAQPAALEWQQNGHAVSGLRPFAEVDEIFDGSPASTSGVMLADQLCKFGTVTAAESRAMQAVAAHLQVFVSAHLCGCWWRLCTRVPLAASSEESHCFWHWLCLSKANEMKA